MERGPCADGPTWDETVALGRRAARRVPAAAIQNLGGAFVIVEGHLVAAQHYGLARSLATFRDTRRVGRITIVSRARKHSISQLAHAVEGVALRAVVPIKDANMTQVRIRFVLVGLA